MTAPRRGQHGLSAKDRLSLYTIAPDQSGCWHWVGVTNPFGYGRVRFDGKLRMAHRVSYEAYIGPIPDGLDIDHLCRNRSCVNPWHLEPVTERENTLRGISIAAVNAKKTHCDAGHAFDAENTWHFRGGRHCRACRRIARLSYLERIRALRDEITKETK